MSSNGILVDTSVWIYFFNGQPKKQVDQLARMIREDLPLYLCPIIIQEVLQGIRSDRDFERVKSSLLAFPIVEWDPVEASLEAASVYRTLRKKGLTIRKSNDCLIAAYARYASLLILHIDRDFSRMAKAGYVQEVA